ncbi:MAG: hypothetical protein ACJ76P_13040 [Actinomycetota bacterium]
MGWRKRFEDAGKYLQRNDGTGGKYEFESRADRMSRRLKGVQGPYEHRDEMTEYIESRSGVEAYVEPKTVMHPLSQVLVAGDGEHRRFTLSDDAYLRELAREREIPILDAARVGYPQRMRDYLKRQKHAAGGTGTSDPRPDTDGAGSRPAGTAGGGEGI